MRLRTALLRLVPIALLLPAAALAQTQTSSAPRPLIARCYENHARDSLLLERTLALHGAGEARIAFPATNGRDVLVYAIEQGVDVQLEAQGAAGDVLSIGDSPITRAGVQRVWIASTSAPASIVVRGLEHEGVSGSVRVRAVALADSRAASSCSALEKNLAAADTAYASGRSVGAGTVAGSTRLRAALESAAAQYEKVSRAFDAAGRVAERGDVEWALAALHYYDLQDWSRSAEWAERAAATLNAAREPYARARAQAVLAAAWLEIATKSASVAQSADAPADSRSLLARARSLLAALERFHAARNEPYDRALQTNNIGLAWFYEARFEPAIAQFRKAQAEFERLRETQRVAIALQNIALCEWGLGRLSAALPLLERALGLMSPQPYPDLYLATLYSSALAHYAAGRFDDALRLNAQSLELATTLQLDRARARSYYGMGVTYYAIGDRDLAARYLRGALDILSADVDARGRVAALRALAVIAHENGDYREAIAHNSEALRLATAPSARSRILLRLAADYAAQGDTSSAIGLLDPMIAVPPNGDSLVQALARAQRAKLHRLAGDLKVAREVVLSAIDTLRAYESVTDEFDARVELARIERDSGDERAALRAITEALALSGEILAQTANPEYRASIAQSVRPALDFKLDILWRRHERFVNQRRLDEAREVALESLRTADRSRAIAFEQLRAQQHVAGQRDAESAELQRRLANLYRDIAERRFQLSTREDRVGTQDHMARALREDIARLRAQVSVIETDLAARAAPRSANAGSKARHDELREVLDAPAGRAFIEYWMGRRFTYAWVVSRGEVSWQRLAASTEIERVARALHDALRSYATVPTSVRLEQAAALHRLVFAPIRARLGNAAELIVVPDRALDYVPFAALRDVSTSGPRYLAQDYGIAIAPALRLAPTRRQPPRPSWSESRMLLVADPVYRADDPRLQAGANASRAPTGKLYDLLRTRSTPEGIAAGRVDPSTLERLYASARESERIRSLPQLGTVDRLEGLDATRARVLAHDFARYRFIHFASHGVIDSDIPPLSSLILGAWGREGRVADQHLRASDLLARTFDAEVVVLSACDTALGREIAGEGLVGLRHAALARGARAVVGSLWPVSDAIAADLMTDMYRHITAEGQPVEVALSAAMRVALTRAPSLDPALWAPFAVAVARDSR